MFFGSWEDIYRTVIVGILAYIGIVVLLRISGNRTLSKMNSFDMIITVAFGSILATILLNKNISLALGLTAFALLVLLQLIITWCSVRSSFVARTVKTESTLLVFDGELLFDSLKKVRVTPDEVMAAIRQQGHGSLSLIDAVFLETDGRMSVVPVTHAGDRTAYGSLAPPKRN